VTLYYSGVVMATRTGTWQRVLGTAENYVYVRHRTAAKWREKWNVHKIKCTKQLYKHNVHDKTHPLNSVLQLTTSMVYMTWVSMKNMLNATSNIW